MSVRNRRNVKKSISDNPYLRSIRKRKRNRGFRDIAQLYRWEQNRKLVIESVFRVGNKVKTTEIAKETEISRQRVLEHLKELQKEGLVKMEGKSGWRVCANFHLRANPLKMIREITNTGGFRMTGHPEIGQISAVEIPKGFLSTSQIDRILKIMKEDIDKKLKGMPDKIMVGFLINTKYLKKLKVPKNIFRGRKLDEKRRKDILDEIKKRQKKAGLDKIAYGLIRKYEEAESRRQAKARADNPDYS